MTLLRWKILTSVALLSLAPSNASWIHSDSGNKDGLLRENELIARSLERALEFIQQRPGTATADVALGVLIANANLQWIYGRLKHYLNGGTWADALLEKLLRQCRDVTGTRRFRNVALLSKDLWENAAGDLKFGLLKQRDEFFLPRFDSCRSIDAYMMKGTPEDSDFCINELLGSRCEVSEYCWLSEINGDSHSGYKTSHRLLYFQVAFKLKCEETNPRKFSGIRDIKNKLCQQMFLEAVSLFQKPSISTTRDLFMEQIALCGFEGHEEFAPDIWRDRVRNWQNSNGCFGLGANFRNCSTATFQGNNSKIKQTDSLTDDCHTHVTAVAISALAFFLRVTLKLVFNLP